MDNKFEYDIQKRAKAGTRATLRAVVSLYLIYMAYLIVKALGKDSPIPLPVGYGIAGIFVAAGIAFGVYTYRRYRIDLADARLTPKDPKASEIPESTEGPEEPEQEETAHDGDV